MLSEVFWIPCTTLEPFRNRKLLLKYRDKIYVGEFKRICNEKFYFILDGGSKIQDRVASHWCVVPNSLLPGNGFTEEESSMVSTIFSLAYQNNPDMREELLAKIRQGYKEAIEAENSQIAEARNSHLSQAHTTPPKPTIAPPKLEEKIDPNEVAGYSEHGIPMNAYGEELPIFDGDFDAL